MNKFHPYTYEGGVSIDEVDDPIIRIARIAQINSYGQTPQQLFTKRTHGPKLTLPQSVFADAIFTRPDKLAPYPLWSIKPDAVGLICFIDDTPVALKQNQVLIYPKGDQILSWGHWDQSLRICSQNTGKVLSVIGMQHDKTLCAYMPLNGTVLVTAGTACTINSTSVAFFF